MKNLFENWRKYLAEIEDEYELPQNPTVFLFEGKSKIPSKEVALDSLIEKYEKGAINENILFNTWQKSYDYEYDLLIQEGIADIIMKPINAFANTKAAIMTKRKAKISISKMAANAFAGVMKIINSVIKKAKSFELNLISTATSKGYDQNKVIGVHQKAMKFLGAAVKKMMSVAGKILKGVFKVFSHPLIKAAIVIISVGILVLSLFKASLFVGAMTAAPAFAVRRLGRKGAIAFWKKIPNAPAAVAESIRSGVLSTKLYLSEADMQVLLEDEMEIADLLGQAMAEIASGIEEGAENETWIQYSSESFVDQLGDEVAMSDEVDMIAFDSELDNNLSAVMDLQRELIRAGSSGIDMENLITMSGQVEDVQLRIIQTALRTASVTCTNDPDMCEAANILANEFEVFNTSTISAAVEIEDYSRMVDGEVVEEWSRILDTGEATSVDTVVRNPFADAASDLFEEASIQGNLRGN